MSNTQPISDPIGTPLSLSAGVGLGPLDHRQGMGALSAPAIGSNSGNRSGIFPGATSGVGVPQPFLVRATGGMNLSVNPGFFVIDRGAAGPYHGYVYGTVNLTVPAANPTNPRIDLLVLRHRDPDLDTNVTETAKLIILPGAPAAVPSEPTASLTDGDMVITPITVRANATAITSSDLDGYRRRFVAARGGISVKVPGDNDPGAYEGQYRDNLADNTLERWSGSAWETIAGSGAWTQFTPRITAYYDGGHHDVNIGATGTTQCTYSVTGKKMELVYRINPRRPMNFYHGQIYTFLPNGYTAKNSFDMLDAVLTTYDGGGTWRGHAEVIYNQLFLYFPTSTSDPRVNAYQVALTDGVPGHSVPYIPNGYADPLRILISGSVEIN